MAEIRIERKGRGLGWLWLFLALVIVAVLAWYFLYPGRSATPAPAPPTTGALPNGEYGMPTHTLGMRLVPQGEQAQRSIPHSAFRIRFSASVGGSHGQHG
jgi:hypothetical protein